MQMKNLNKNGGRWTADGGRDHYLVSFLYYIQHLPSAVRRLPSALFLILLLSSCGSTVYRPTKIPIKVVVVTMFEMGEDTGDTPGEFQYWVERLPLKQEIPFPQGTHPLRYNREKGVLGLLTGVGTAKASASVMALGMDERFDLTNAYWVVAGISGIDPEDGSSGSAVWADWLVDGDLAHEIDPREIPQDWNTGYLPLQSSQPFELPRPQQNFDCVSQLNPQLVNWAYGLTRDMQLHDTDEIQYIRTQYQQFPKAQLPPTVLKGAQLSASTYWHGKYLNAWANEWTKYWTGGKGNFVTSAMEDTGTLQALNMLEKAGKADKDRLLVLRTASNYTMQGDGMTAVQSLTGENLAKKGYTAYIPALEAAYVVGSKVVDELSAHWEQYKNELPGDQ